MAKYKNEVSAQTIAESEKIAKANQRPGQTKEQTKLVAKGIQKGIEQYKKQHKSKARELDKKLKNMQAKLARNEEAAMQNSGELESHGASRWLVILPWGLLVLSWLLFFGVSYFSG